MIWIFIKLFVSFILLAGLCWNVFTEILLLLIDALAKVRRYFTVQVQALCFFVIVWLLARPALIRQFLRTLIRHERFLKDDAGARHVGAATGNVVGLTVLARLRRCRRYHDVGRLVPALVLRLFTRIANSVEGFVVRRRRRLNLDRHQVQWQLQGPLCLYRRQEVSLALLRRVSPALIRLRFQKVCRFKCFRRVLGRGVRLPG